METMTINGEEWVKKSSIPEETPQHDGSESRWAPV